MDFFVLVGIVKVMLMVDYFMFMVFCGVLVVVVLVKIVVKCIMLDMFFVLMGLGVLVVLIKYLLGGINLLYMYLCGMEVLYVMEGILMVGLVDISNKFFIKVLEVGDVFVFFKGMVYYQINFGYMFVMVFVSFSSFNFGIVLLFVILFGFGIFDEVYIVVFKVNEYVVNKLQVLFGMQVMEFDLI